MNHKIAIIIVNFHSEITHEFENVFEVIVVDNSKINRGFARAVNIGIKKALNRGAENILLLNPDCEISAEDIEKLSKNNRGIVSPVLSFKRNGKEILDFGGKINWMFGRTTHYESDSGPGQNDDDLGPQRSEDRSRECDYVSGACMLVEKEVFEKIGFLDENFFLYFEDADFCLRAKAAGFTVAVDQNVVVEHNLTEHRFSRDPFKIRKILESNLYFINKWTLWYFKPLALGYWVALSFKSVLSLIPFKKFF